MRVMLCNDIKNMKSQKSILKIITVGFVLLFLQVSKAQEVWSLEKCIAHAQSNSRSVAQSKNAVRDAEFVKKGNKYQALPTVNGNSTYAFNFGRSVNPSTYQYDNTSTNYNSWGLNMGVPIFNAAKSGGRISDYAKQSDSDLKAAQADLQQTQNTIGLQVAQAYLQILLNDEQLANAKRRAEQDLTTLDKIEKQIKAGSLPATSRLDAQVTVAKSEQQTVIAENNVALGYLNLRNLLELPTDMVFNIEKPILEVPDQMPIIGNLGSVYTEALVAQPNIKAAEMRIKSAEFGLKISQSALLPSLNGFGSLASNYSNAIKDFTKGTVTSTDVKQTVVINNVSTDVIFKQAGIINSPTTPYFDQFSNNFGQSVGLRLSIPILNGFSQQIAVQRQKLVIDNQTIAFDKAKLQLRSDVQTSLTNLIAAKKQYAVAVKVFSAQKLAYEALEKKLAIGASNTFEISQSKSTLDTAERDVTVAKFDYLFKQKIVEFYEGKQLSLGNK